MDRSAAPLLEDAHAFLVMRNLYAAAGRQLTLKFEALNSEFNVLYARNPIHHIESRVKSPESIMAKLLKKGLPLTLESAMQNVNDIAGVRVVCSYIDDVYRVAEMVERQQDLEIVKRQDYIKTPNYNGYRSLHLDLRVPVYLSNRTEQVLAEVQIRTIAMDFWASLEHDIRYKADRSRLPAGINEEMLACAGKIAEIDRQMQDMYQRIKAAEAVPEEPITPTSAGRLCGRVAGAQQVHLLCLRCKEAGLRADRDAVPQNGGQREGARQAVVQGTGRHR